MIDKSIPFRDGLPTQSLKPSVLKHMVVDGTDVALCMRMHVANINQLPTGTPVEFCQACYMLVTGQWKKAEE